MKNENVKKIVVDLDDTITVTEKGDYEHSKPVLETIKLLREYKEKGFQIIIHSSRQMRTYEGQVGKINVHTLPNIIKWLNDHRVPYDEIIVGKPWCGFEGWYVDDKSIRPSEFHRLNIHEIEDLLRKEKDYIHNLATKD